MGCGGGCKSGGMAQMGGERKGEVRMEAGGRRGDREGREGRAREHVDVKWQAGDVILNHK